VKLDVRIISASDREAEVRSLYDWLRSEQDLHGSVVGLAPPPVRDGELGAGLDIVTVALGSGGTVSVLAGSLGVWLRNRGTDLTFEISGPKGRIFVDAKRVGNPKELIETIVAAVGGEQ
jgi:hypothetical protein